MLIFIFGDVNTHKNERKMCLFKTDDEINILFLGQFFFIIKKKNSYVKIVFKKKKKEYIV